METPRPVKPGFFYFYFFPYGNTKWYEFFFQRSDKKPKQVQMFCEGKTALNFVLLSG